MVSPNLIRNLLHSELGPFIIVVNHQHSIDILFLFEIWYVHNIQILTTFTAISASEIY